ncbi:MAG: hypothetical protein IT258_07080 [Saprospiraceae bacterium]|nr:hypothetical protein [Saprospiraceae bacterium]
MFALQELIHLVTKYKRKEVKVLGYNPDANDRYEIFYNLLAEGKLNTDDEAARHFFGTDKAGSYIEYRNLRNSFFKRLVNTFFFIDVKKAEFNDAQAALHTCYRNMAAVKMLVAREARHAAHEIAEKTIEQAVKFELTEVVLELARNLLGYYTYIEQDERKRSYYERLVDESYETLGTTIQAEKMYLELIAPYVKSKASKPWVSEKAAEALVVLGPFVQKHHAHRLHFLFHLISRLERASVHDHVGTAEVCKRAIRYFEGRFATPKSVPGMFAHTLIVSLTMLRKYEEAEEWAKYAENLVEPGIHNWFKGLEQQIVLQFHKQDYPAALIVYQKASSHKHFGHLATIEQQTWKLYEAYIQLFIAAGKIKLTEAEQKKSGFRPTKFLNEVPEFAKDKRGMNIPVLIIHAIFLLYLKRHDDAYDRFLALDKYADRHLKEGDDAFRSYCFIKALLQIQKADFIRKGSEEKAADWIRRMSTQPVMLADAPHEVESIPYEHLWNMAMEALEQSAGLKLSN